MLSLLFIAIVIGLGSCELGIKNCPYGLKRDEYLQTFGTHCFRFVLNTKKDYEDANNDCKSVAGGSLAMPKTKDIDEFLVKQLMDTYTADSPVWIGLDDDRIENKFFWKDGTPLNMTDGYKNFARFEGPRKSYIQGDFEDCVAIDPKEDGKWHDYHCESEFFHLFNAEKYYVCQYSMINLPTPPPPTCKPSTCDLDCGLNGFKTDEQGCRLCQCDD